MVPACALKSQGDRMLLISGMNTQVSSATTQALNRKKESHPGSTLRMGPPTVMFRRKMTRHTPR